MNQVNKGYDPSSCECIPISKRHAGFFQPLGIPKDCHLLSKPHNRPCDIRACGNKAIVQKYIGFRYTMMTESAVRYDSWLRGPFPKLSVAPQIEKTERVELCHDHFIESYHSSCEPCATRWMVMKSNNNTKSTHRVRFALTDSTGAATK